MEILARKVEANEKFDINYNKYRVESREREFSVYNKLGRGLRITTMTMTMMLMHWLPWTLVLTISSILLTITITHCYEYALLSVHYCECVQAAAVDSCRTQPNGNQMDTSSHPTNKSSQPELTNNNMRAWKTHTQEWDRGRSRILCEHFIMTCSMSSFSLVAALVSGRSRILSVRK